MLPKDKGYIAYFDECLHYAPPIESMRQQMRIACFGSDRDNLLMWSHYADGLRGFCIIFEDYQVVKGERKGYFVEVVCVDMPPSVESFVYVIAWDRDWYSQPAIEETNIMIKHHGKTERHAYTLMYEKFGAEALRTMLEIWQNGFAAKPNDWRY